MNLNDVYVSIHKFKVFNNLIIFYKGTESSLFLSSVSELLVDLIIDFFQKDILKKIFNKDFFYFDSIERKEILEKAEAIILEDSEIFLENRKILFNTFYNFLLQNKKLYLSGFLNFRIKKYKESLEKNIDMAVNQYLIEKEYLEFVSLLKMYVNSEISNIDIVHLIYDTTNPILLDKDKNIIKTDMNLMNAKYLSDITFSSCDMILNTLLNLIPQKIYIHLLFEEDNDEFINTLKLIFDDRIFICKKDPSLHFFIGDSSF